MAVYDQGQAPMTGAARAGALVNYAGAAVSLALIVGVGVWGYKLVVRDVSGIPVVRAMAGDMRVLPDNPGGEVSDHTGLSVNEVAAMGEAAAPEDSVALAPATNALAPEDIVAQSVAEAQEITAIDPSPTASAVQAALNETPEIAAPTGPLSTDDILALADQIAAGAAPLTDLAEGTDVAPSLSVDGQAITNPAGLTAVRVSLRPVVRPARTQTASASASSAPVAKATSAPAVTTASFAVGTKLVQLGAFPTADVAAAEWDRLNGRFGDVMGGKSRVIQAATSSGKTFYRLRAQGFAELGDARRFCAALIAEGTDCIPVVVR